MITNEGKTYIKRYLAAQVPAVAQAIAWGVGGRAEDANDTGLQFEVGRTDIMLSSFDFVGNRVVFKAVLPDDLAAKIYEVALFSQIENPVAGNFSSKVLASFDSDTEEWVNSADSAAPVYSTGNARLGGDSLSLVTPAGTTLAYVLNDIVYDLSGNSGADVFKFAFNVAGSVPTNVKFHFRTDASNYYTYTLAAPAGGYRIESIPKGNAVVTGTPSWETINSIEVEVNAAAGGPATIDFDGIRIEDTDTINPEYVMVARELLSSPFTKTEGKTQEIEFSLNVSI